MNNLDLDELRRERERLVRVYDELIKASNEFDGKMQSRYDTQKEEYAGQANMVQGAIVRVDRQIAQLESLLVSNQSGDVVGIGSRVKLRVDQEEPFEALVISDTGGNKVSGMQLVSLNSPLGKAINGKHSGELVEVEAPGGRFTVAIIAIL
jgi:transcription elongation factor GreA